MTLQLRADVSTVDTDDGLVLLDERAGRYWQLNASGAFVLRALLDGSCAQEAAGKLTDQHAVTSEKAATDVAALLEHLRAAGLVTG
ncbi:MAG: lasso peptide biosynthesis PqqD family chaperone [Egibacteraceae bacterium]